MKDNRRGRGRRKGKEGEKDRGNLKWGGNEGQRE